MLALSFAQGRREKLRVSSTTRLIQQQQVLATISLETSLEAEILEIDAGRGAHFHYALGPLRVETRGDERIRGLLVAGADGARVAGTAFVTKSGSITDHRFDPPHDERSPAAGLALSLLSAITEFPDQPLGVGARWEVSVDAQSGELSLTETTSRDLLAITKKAVRYRVAQSETVSADGGTLAGAADPPSSGEWLHEFSRIFPQGKHVLEQSLSPEGGLLVSTELRLDWR